MNSTNQHLHKVGYIHYAMVVDNLMIKPTRSAENHGYFFGNWAADRKLFASKDTHLAGNPSTPAVPVLQGWLIRISKLQISGWKRVITNQGSINEPMAPPQLLREFFERF